jgi:hypothetical protein
MTKQTEVLEKAAQDCLQTILVDRISLKSALQAYPDLADELRPRLEAVLWLKETQAHLALRPGFAASGRRRLVEQIKHSPGGRRGWLLQPAWQRRHVSPLQRTVLSMAMVLVLLANATAVKAAAQVSYPGDAFYLVKRVEERLQLTVSPMGVRSLELHLAFALRRTVELETLILEGKTEYMPQTVADFERQVEQAANLLARLDPEEKSQSDLLVMELERSLANQAGALKVLVQLTPAGNQPELLKTIHAAELGLLAWHTISPESTSFPYRN